MHAVQQGRLAVHWMVADNCTCGDPLFLPSTDPPHELIPDNCVGTHLQA